MKKQGSNKTLLRWLIPAVIVAVLAVAGLVTFLALGGKSADTAAGQSQSEELILYWNVDRKDYAAMGAQGASSRVARSDGYYYIRVAANGEQMDVPVESLDLVNRIDTVDVMSLIFDDNGVVVDMLTINQCTGGTIAPVLYVKSVDGNNVVANTQGGFKGLDIAFTTNENTKIYDVSGTGPLVGVPSDIRVDDEIVAIRDLEGNVSYVFLKGYSAPKDIYWNCERKYDSAAKITTRDSNVLGVYEFLMGFNGEQVTIRVRDHALASKIDSLGAKYMGIEFDDDGYAVSVTQSNSKLNVSGTFASWAYVDKIDGNTFHAINKEGVEFNGVFTDATKIMAVDPQGGYSCEYTQLRYGDKIHCMLDQRSRISHIFVHSRLAETPLYWNTERKYDSDHKVTTRTPAPDGYYYFDLASNGQPVRVRTKDRAMATKIDGYATRCFTLKLDGSDIVSFGTAESVHGNTYVFGSWAVVDEIDGNKLTVKKFTSTSTEVTHSTGVMSEEVEIINGSNNYISHCGEYSTLAVGDRVHCLLDIYGEIRVIFIVEKAYHTEIYWNLVRMYNSTTQQTTRTPDAEGYYHFNLAWEGQQVHLKTKDKTIANKIDGQASKAISLETDGDIITAYRAYTAVYDLFGSSRGLSWVDVLTVTQNGFTAQKNEAGHANDGKIFKAHFAWDCKVINTTNGFVSHAGEFTELRVGDKVHVLHDNDLNAKYIFVVSGREPEPLTTEEDCPCATITDWQPWDGTTDLVSGNYYLTQDVVAPKDGFLLQYTTVNLRLDGHTISSEGRCFYTKNDAHLNICDHTGSGKLIGSGVTGESGGVIRMYSEVGGACVKLWNLTLTTNGKNTPDKGGLVSASAPIYLYNCTLEGGKASTSGGNIHVNPTGVLQAFNTTIIGGNAPTGGNIHHQSGWMNLVNVTIRDGQSTGKSDNMNIKTTNWVKFKDVTITNSDATGGSGVTFAGGTIGLSGNIQICENGKNDVVMSTGACFTDEGMDAASRIRVESPEQTILTNAKSDLSGCFISFDSEDYQPVYDSENKSVFFRCLIVPRIHQDDHCVCGGLGNVGDHTCTAVAEWIPITDEVFDTVDGLYGFKEDGHYYLTEDYTPAKRITVRPGQNISICLNGYTLSRSSTLFYVGGHANVCDCHGDGVMSGNYAGDGGNVKLVSGASMNFYGGTITRGSAKGVPVALSMDKEGIVATNTEPSTFKMYGGTITGGTTAGNVKIWASANFVMYGGTIKNGTSTGNGGNINCTSAGTIKLLGGTLTGGSAATADGAYFSKGTITVGGTFRGDIYLADGAKLAISTEKPLTTGASIGIEMAKPGVFAQNVATDVSGYFTGDVTYNATAKTLSLTVPVITHDHCVCGGLGKVGDHTCTTVVDWIPVTEDVFDTVNSLYGFKEDGHYYLTGDFTPSKRITIRPGQNISLCLNGYTLSRSSTLFYVGGHANVCDCRGGGVMTGNYAGDGGNVKLVSGSSMNFYGGTITRGSAKGVPVALSMDKEGIAPTNTEPSTFKMYGGTITGGTTAGNVKIWASANFIMYGGTIKNGTSTGTGGNIVCSSTGTIKLLGGTVTGGSAATGNDVYFSKGTPVVGGTFQGDIYLASGVKLAISTEKPLTTGASVGIQMATLGVFAQNVATDVSSYFTGNVSYDPTEQTLTLNS